MRCETAPGYCPGAGWMDWLITEYGFSPTDAYCLVSTCPDFQINVYQMCRLGKLNYIAGAELPKRYVVTS
jgi:amidase